MRSRPSAPAGVTIATDGAASAARDALRRAVDDGRERRDRDVECRSASLRSRCAPLAADLLPPPSRTRSGSTRTAAVSALLSATTYSRCALAVDARERVDARVAAGVAVLLRAVAQRRVRRVRSARLLIVRVERVRRVEVVVHRRRVRADVVVLAGRRRRTLSYSGVLAGEHVLPRVLVAARAGEALLVAVVDDRVAAREVHQRVRELVALRAARPRVARGLSLRMNMPDATHVVVAQEGREVVDVRVAVGVPVVVAEEVAQLGRSAASSRRSARRRPGTGSRGPLDVVVRHVVRGDRPRWSPRPPRRTCRSRACPAASRSARSQGANFCQNSSLTCFIVSMRKPSMCEVPDPRLVDVDHAVDDLRVLREEVVEAEEVAVLGVLAGERRVAAVVVERHVVEPGRDLDVRSAAGTHGW